MHFAHLQTEVTHQPCGGQLFCPLWDSSALRKACGWREKVLISSTSVIQHLWYTRWISGDERTRSLILLRLLSPIIHTPCAVLTKQLSTARPVDYLSVEVSRVHKLESSESISLINMILLCVSGLQMLPLKLMLLDFLMDSVLNLKKLQTSLFQSPCLIPLHRYVHSNAIKSLPDKIFSTLTNVRWL